MEVGLNFSGIKKKKKKKHKQMQLTSFKYSNHVIVNFCKLSSSTFYNFNL
jgi:hypothetical protein